MNSLGNWKREKYVNIGVFSMASSNIREVECGPVRSQTSQKSISHTECEQKS